MQYAVITSNSAKSIEAMMNIYAKDGWVYRDTQMYRAETPHSQAPYIMVVMERERPFGEEDHNA